MKTSELRIGNVFKQGVLHSLPFLTGIHMAQLYRTKDSRKSIIVELSELTPIELSLGWFESRGYDTVGGNVRIADCEEFYLEYNTITNKIDVKFYCIGGIESIPVKVIYLHELQNLVYDITKVEMPLLDIKL